MKRRLLTAVVGAMATIAVALGFPFVARHLEFFRVRQVELVGVRYLSPDLVLDAMRLDPRASVFGDTEGLRQRVESIGGVIAARIDRRLPATLRVVVSEQVPMAFVPGPQGLVALDAAAHPLPYDPTASELDLPIVVRADTALVRALATVRYADPDLYQEVESIRYADGGGVHLAVGSYAILMRNSPTAGEVDAVRVVRQHLAASQRAYGELDARFGGWVVVRPGTGGA